MPSTWVSNRIAWRVKFEKLSVLKKLLSEVTEGQLKDKGQSAERYQNVLRKIYDLL